MYFPKSSIAIRGDLGVLGDAALLPVGVRVTRWRLGIILHFGESDAMPSVGFPLHSTVLLSAVFMYVSHPHLTGEDAPRIQATKIPMLTLTKFRNGHAGSSGTLLGFWATGDVPGVLHTRKG